MSVDISFIFFLMPNLEVINIIQKVQCITLHRMKKNACIRQKYPTLEPFWYGEN